MSTVRIEPMAPPPSRLAARRTNHCATAPFPKKSGLDATYLMRHLPRHGLSPDVTTVAAQHYDCSFTRYDNNN